MFYIRVNNDYSIGVYLKLTGRNRRVTSYYLKTRPNVLRLNRFDLLQVV